MYFLNLWEGNCDSDSKTIPAYRRQGPQTLDCRRLDSPRRWEMARDYTKIKAWQLAVVKTRLYREELGLLVYMKEFQKSEIGLISYIV